MSCQCHQIGGPFIAEDPDCEVHGRQAQEAEQERGIIIERLAFALEWGDEDEVRQRSEVALQYLRSL